MTAICPVCQATLTFDDSEVFELGETIECAECGDELEVVSVTPLEFEGLAYEGEDDGGYDDEEDDDEYEDDEDDDGGYPDDPDDDTEEPE